MCIFLNTAPLPIYSIATTWFWGVLGSQTGSAEGVGRDWPEMGKMVQNTTEVGIFAILGGQKWPSSSYLGRAGAYSNANNLYILWSYYLVQVCPF